MNHTQRNQIYKVVNFVSLYVLLMLSGYADPVLEKRDLPETTREIPSPAPGMRTSSTVSEYRRGGILVAKMVTQKSQVGTLPSRDTSYVMFFLPDGSSVKRQIAPDGFVRVNGEGRMYINNTAGSIGVISKDGLYCEVFMIESRTFLETDARRNLRNIMQSEADDERRLTEETGEGVRRDKRNETSDKGPRKPEA